MNRYNIVSKTYVSNCFIEAIKAKIKNRNVKLYYCKPRIGEHGKLQFFHFMWSDGLNDYDFSDFCEDQLPWYKCFIFKGYIRQFDLGMADRYSRYRNGKHTK